MRKRVCPSCRTEGKEEGKDVMGEGKRERKFLEIPWTFSTIMYS